MTNARITFPKPTADWGVVTGVLICPPTVTDSMRDWLCRINEGLRITVEPSPRERTLSRQTRIDMRERSGKWSTRRTISYPMVRRLLDSGLVYFEALNGEKVLTLTPAGKAEAR